MRDTYLNTLYGLAAKDNDVVSMVADNGLIAFLAYRAYEFIRDDVCFQNQNVKIVGIGTGMTYSTLGPTHHTTEDIGLLRGLPNLTLFSPATKKELSWIMKETYRIKDPVYIRLGNNKEFGQGDCFSFFG